MTSETPTIVGGDCTIEASLRVFGSTLDPALITEALGCEPDFECRAGDPIPRTRSGRRRYGMWLAESKLPRTSGLEEHLGALLKILPEAEVWSVVTEGVEKDVFCGVYANRASTGLSIQPDQLAKLGAYGLRLEFDIYATEEPSL